MPLKTAKPKASVQSIASSTGTNNATLQEEVESLRRQLAESESYTATLQVTIKVCNTSAFTDLDYKYIAAAIQQQQSRDQSRDCFLTDALSASTYWLPKQLDLSLLSDSKDPTYMS